MQIEEFQTHVPREEKQQNAEASFTVHSVYLFWSQVAYQYDARTPNIESRASNSIDGMDDHDIGDTMWLALGQRSTIGYFWMRGVISGVCGMKDEWLSRSGRCQKVERMVDEKGVAKRTGCCRSLGQGTVQRGCHP